MFCEVTLTFDLYRILMRPSEPLCRGWRNSLRLILCYHIHKKTGWMDKLKTLCLGRVRWSEDKVFPPFCINSSAFQILHENHFQLWIKWRSLFVFISAREQCCCTAVTSVLSFLSCQAWVVSFCLCLSLVLWSLASWLWSSRPSVRTTLHRVRLQTGSGGCMVPGRGGACPAGAASWTCSRAHEWTIQKRAPIGPVLQARG